jgi:phospholipase/lecithinase/hemolysin
MPRRSLIAAAAMLTLSAGQALAAFPYSAIYSFGDSLSDVGNVYIATGGVEPASPYVGGQFSNGPVWVQDLASFMGLPALTPSSSVGGGNDFAYGFATAGTSNTVVPNLQLQVGSFLSAMGGAPSNALYTFSIGANDLFNILDGSAPATDLPTDAQAVATAALDLELAGAKDLMLFGVPNLGLTPAIQGAGVTGLPTLASTLSQDFNAAVLSDISAQVPGLTVYYVDAYELLTDAVSEPAQYGFSNVADPCWTGDYTGYATGGSLCSTDPAMQNQYLFWDNVHPTEAGHLLIAEAGARLIGVAVPEPSTWTMIVAAFIGIGALGARKVRRPSADGRLGPAARQTFVGAGRTAQLA